MGDIGCSAHCVGNCFVAHRDGTTQCATTVTAAACSRLYYRPDPLSSLNHRLQPHMQPMERDLALPVKQPPWVTSAVAGMAWATDSLRIEMVRSHVLPPQLLQCTAAFTAAWTRPPASNTSQSLTFSRVGARWHWRQSSHRDGWPELQQANGMGN